MKKKYILFWITSLVLDVVVYLDKIYQMNNWYVDNLIKIYFLYLLGLSLLLGFSTLIFMFASRHVTINSSTKIESVIRESELKLSKFAKILSFPINIGFGVIGCWWFFAISIANQCLSFIIVKQTREIFERLKAENPEKFKDIPKKESKRDPKLKFKFIKKS